MTEYLIPAREVAHLPGGGSRTLVAQEGDEVSVGVVLDEATRRTSSTSDPRERLDSSNLGAFSTLTEEVSHFLYLLFRARSERPVTRLELELQAEVDKYLIALFFLEPAERGRRLRRGCGSLLFDRYRLAEGLSAESAERYHEASRLARRYCGWLEARYLRSRRLARTWPARRGGSGGSARGRSWRRSRRYTEGRMSRPDPETVAEEQRRADRLRRTVDVACAVLRQGRLTRAEAEAVVAHRAGAGARALPGQGRRVRPRRSPRASGPHPRRAHAGRPGARVLPFRARHAQRLTQVKSRITPAASK